MIEIWESPRWQGTFRKCVEFAKKCGLPLSRRLCPILYAMESKTAWGVTVKPCRGPIRIAITTGLVDDFAGKKGYLSTRRRDALCSVIFHELVHTCPGCFNHGPRWKRWVKALNANGCGIDLHPYGKHAPPYER